MSHDSHQPANDHAVTHGCCAQARFVNGETEADWQELLQNWLNDYQPDNPTFRSLVEQTADAEWHLRVVREYDLHEQDLYSNGSPLTWTNEQHLKRERFLRYRTTAERRFHRFRNAVELTVKNRQIEIHRRLMLEAQYAREAETKKAKAKSADTAETKESPFDRYPKCTVLPIPQLHQFISVSIKDGQTHTQFHPSNEELLKKEPVQTPPPIQVTRRIACLGKFWPPEYLWVRREMPWPQVTDQVLTMEEWHAALEREKDSPHIGPKSPQPLEIEPNEREPGDQDEKNGFS